MEMTAAAALRGRKNITSRSVVRINHGEHGDVKKYFPVFYFFPVFPVLPVVDQEVDFLRALSADGKLLRRNRVSFSILRLSFVIAGIAR
ncbi:MAG: hypothetical protein ACREAB_09580, partial [Blastocatellia bacterium]